MHIGKCRYAWRLGDMLIKICGNAKYEKNKGISNQRCQKISSKLLYLNLFE